MRKISVKTILAAAGVLLLNLAGLNVAFANTSMLGNFHYNKPTFVHHHPFAKKKLVIQVSQANKARWNLVLNNTQNLLNYLGQEEVQIVVVTFGPGVKMLLAHSPVAQRIQAINAEGVEFDACHNTMMAMKKKFGHMPKLLPAAVIVPAGIVRIMQLESHGFDYVKP